MLANHVNLRIARGELVSEATWGVPEGKLDKAKGSAHQAAGDVRDAMRK